MVSSVAPSLPFIFRWLHPLTLKADKKKKISDFQHGLCRMRPDLAAIIAAVIEAIIAAATATGAGTFKAGTGAIVRAG